MSFCRSEVPKREFNKYGQRDSQEALVHHPLQTYSFQVPDYLAKLINQQIIVHVAFLIQSKVKKKECCLKFCQLGGFSFITVLHQYSKEARQFSSYPLSDGACNPAAASVNLYSFSYSFPLRIQNWIIHDIQLAYLLFLFLALDIVENYMPVIVCLKSDFV